MVNTGRYNESGTENVACGILECIVAVSKEFTVDIVECLTDLGSLAVFIVGCVGVHNNRYVIPLFAVKLYGVVEALKVSVSDASVVVDSYLLITGCITASAFADSRLRLHLNYGEAVLGIGCDIKLGNGYLGVGEEYALGVVRTVTENEPNVLFNVCTGFVLPVVRALTLR